MTQFVTISVLKGMIFSALALVSICIDILGCSLAYFIFYDSLAAKSLVGILFSLFMVTMLLAHILVSFKWAAGHLQHTIGSINRD